MTGHPPHHLNTIKSKGGDLTAARDDLRAYQMAYEGYGVEDIAVQFFGDCSSASRRKAHDLINSGRAFSSQSVS